MPVDPRGIESTTPEGRQAGWRADIERRINALERRQFVAAGDGPPPSDLPAGVLWIDQTNSRLYTRIAGVLKSATFT